MKIKAPWGCEDPYCWDHVILGVVLFGFPLGTVLYTVLSRVLCNAGGLSWLR